MICCRFILSYSLPDLFFSRFRRNRCAGMNQWLVLEE